MTKRGTTSAMSDPTDRTKTLFVRNRVIVVRGQKVNAAYTASPIPEFQGNPLIEALPSVFHSCRRGRDALVFPSYNPKQNASCG